MKKATIVIKVKEAAQRLDGKFCTSKRGVPLIILPYQGKRGTLCYFASTKKWKWFFPVFENAEAQIKLHFEGVEDFKHDYDNQMLARED